MVGYTESGAFSERERSNQVSTEAELVKLAQGGDQQAFAKLCDDYYIKIQRYLIRIVGNDNVGEDLTQETFVKAWNSLLTLREVSRFGSWLYQIARNIAFSYLRCQKHRPTNSLDVYTAGGDREDLSVPGPEDGVAQSELLELALSQIRPIYRDCLILYVKEELSLREVAKRLNLKEASIGTYISRAKQELRRVYQELLKDNNNNAPTK